MKILFILTNYPGFGGIEKVTQYITNYLCGHDFEISIVAFGTNAPNLSIGLHAAITLYYVPKPQEYNASENFDYIRGILSNNQFECVVLQDSYAPIERLFVEIDYPWKEKLIVVEHNSPRYNIKTVNSYFYYNRGWKFFLVRLLKYPFAYVRAFYQSCKRHRLLLSICRRYVVLSNAYIPELKLISLKTKLRKVHSIGNPLTIQPSSEDYIAKKKQVLFVGRFTNSKGIDFLLSIWKKFVDKSLDRWELVIVGDGEESRNIEARITKEKIANVRIDAPTPNIAKYYEESSILAMTSIYEGFPLIIAEAMSRGCVPIAFDSFASIHDIITDNVNGALVHPFCIDEYVESLHQLINDPQKLHLMSVSARKTVDRFSVDTIGEQWIKLLNQDH